MTPSDQPSQEETCQVYMSDLEGCGRPVHHAPSGIDKEPVCLMHSRDPNKDDAEFEEEIRAILRRKSKYHRPQDTYDFLGFVFPQEVNFSPAPFTKSANFTRATFTQKANFSQATFTRNADFSWATFSQHANFYGAGFTQNADFRRTKFTQNASFSWVTFTQDADFWAATFTQDANFSGATFNRDAYFVVAAFLGVADFSDAGFKEPARVLFHRVNEPKEKGKEQGEENGMRARFTGCLLEGARFEDVNWHRSRNRLILQDELDLGTQRDLTHELVADVYRRMVKNFETNRQYALAEDCFIGEMEMRRLNPRNFPFARYAGSFYKEHRWASWLGKQCSFTNFYRVLSDYGSSYRRALFALLGLLFLFALLLPTFGLRMSPGSPAQAAPGTPEPAEISWRSAWANPPRISQSWGTLRAGLLASIEIATFQKSPARVPANGSARLVAAVETVVIPGQLAIFLLALRRRFRR